MTSARATAAQPGPSTERPPTYCEAAECEEETREGRRFCSLHWKRHQRGKRGESLSAPKAERLPPAERALDLVGQWVEAPAEDDREYAARKRKALAAVKELGHHQVRESIRRGMAEARASGVRLGAPRKLAGAEDRARALVARVGVAAAADALGVSRRTVSRLLHGTKGNNLSPPPEGRRGSKGNLPAQVHAEP